MELVLRYSNTSIALACGVSETAVRKWLVEMEIVRPVYAKNFGRLTPKLRRDAALRIVKEAENGVRLTKERVGRLISRAGQKAGIIVVNEDSSRNERRKYASAHDLRRGCALRLIDSGVSAETLKVVMRHRSFATTEEYYAATRTAQAAGAELAKIAAGNPSLVGGSCWNDRALCY